MTTKVTWVQWQRSSDWSYHDDKGHLTLHNQNSKDCGRVKWHAKSLKCWLGWLASPVSLTLSPLRKDLHQVYEVHRLQLHDSGHQIHPPWVHLLLLSVKTLQWTREKCVSEISGVIRLRDNEEKEIILSQVQISVCRFFHVTLHWTTAEHC